MTLTSRGALLPGSRPAAPKHQRKQTRRPHVTEEIYASSPYDVRGQKDTPNALDGIATANLAPLAMVTSSASAGDVARILVTVA